MLSIGYWVNQLSHNHTFKNNKIEVELLCVDMIFCYMKKARGSTMYINP